MTKGCDRTRRLPTSELTDWYHEGQARTVDVDGVRITVRLVTRKGRRARIAITAPPGAVFSSADEQAKERA